MAIEDKVIDNMLGEDAPLIGGSAYSMMDASEQAPIQQAVYEYFAPLYQNRDMANYGRLSFKDYVSGLTPEEGFITDLGNMAPGDTTENIAVLWNEVFGEDTQEMKDAAMQFLLENPDSMNMPVGD